MPRSDVEMQLSGCPFSVTEVAGMQGVTVAPREGCSVLVGRGSIRTPQGLTTTEVTTMISALHRHPRPHLEAWHHLDWHPL